MANWGEVVPQGGESVADASGSGFDPLVVRAQTLLGTTLRDKWHLEVLLGVGGMASVYAATHRNGSRAAVKILHPEMSTNAFVRERFLWEGYVANAVAHEGAVKVIDDDTAEDGSLFLVTELLDGETLEERRIRLGGRMPAEEVLVVTDQLLDVLTAAHAKGIVHRDLKPENIFLTRTGQVKVLDFGIARLRELSSPKGLTQTGAMVGTPAYMAPEHARGLSDEVDERSDLWACGATMFSLLSNRNVHEGRTVNEQLANAITKPAPRLASVAPELEAAVQLVVDRALEFSKDMRWPDAASMQAALRRAYQEIYDRPIASAPRVTVGNEVPDRTLLGKPSGPQNRRGVPTTGRPVASSRRPALLSPLLRTRQATIAVAGAVAFGIAVTSVVWMVAGGVRSASRMQATSAAVMAAKSAQDVPDVPVETNPSLTPLNTPEIAATDLPSVVPEPPPPQRERGSTRRTAPPAATSAPASPHTNCQPPYTVDAATGKKQWKLECL